VPSVTVVEDVASVSAASPSRYVTRRATALWNVTTGGATVTALARMDVPQSVTATTPSVSARARVSERCARVFEPIVAAGV
jgi:hypothetical protein|tara:strand:- start:2888 stop:3130 length:243 start_codon:yes stop_codon:yes gene_type:complete